MSAVKTKPLPSLPFDELFKAVELNALAAVHALILKFPSDLQGKEAVYHLLNRAHPQRQLSILQFAVGRYPKTSLKLIEILLEYGAGTELPLNHKEIQNKSVLVSCLWIAVKRKLPVEVIRLLLNYKADVLFKSDCSPFSEDEKSNLVSNDEEGFSLLHLATKIEADDQILRIILENSNGLLIHDQSNHMKQTPLMISAQQNNEIATKILLEVSSTVDLKDSNDLTAYEIAAKEKNIKICLLFPEILENYNYVLEIVKKIDQNTWRSKSGHIIHDLNESDELLPIEGYWEWNDSWSQAGEDLHCRLRKRIEIADQFYLKQSIDLVRRSLPQKALNILLEGLQHESDPQKKSRAANYFQRLLQTVERGGANALGLLDNLSRSNLVILADEAVKSSSTINLVRYEQQRLPPVTREFPNYKSTQGTHVADYETEYDSDDSLLYCPVCSHRFDTTPSDKSKHLQSCLTSPRNKLIGNRYTNLQENTKAEECPICYDEMKEGVVMMNCLCKFHGNCIEEWLKRGKQCPYHSE